MAHREIVSISVDTGDAWTEIELDPRTFLEALDVTRESTGRVVLQLAPSIRFAVPVSAAARALDVLRAGVKDALDARVRRSARRLPKVRAFHRADELHRDEREAGSAGDAA